MSVLHPNAALYDPTHNRVSIASCDHYAGTEKLIKKSLSLQQSLGPVFDITCDLEDGAARGSESAQLKLVIGAVNSADNKFNQVGARVHDFFSALWPEQISSLVKECGTRLSHLTIPKVESVSALREMIAHLTSARERHSVERVIPVHVLIESSAAVESVFEIAGLPAVRCLDFGLMDFISQADGTIPQSCMQSPGQFEHALLVKAKTAIVAAAVHCNKIAAHNVTVLHNDAKQTESDARLARQHFGFTRMWSIHPNQVQAIINGMSPTVDEITLACAVLPLAQDAHWGPTSLDNRLHDRASYRHLWQTLQLAHRSGTILPKEISKRFFND